MAKMLRNKIIMPSSALRVSEALTSFGKVPCVAENLAPQSPELSKSIALQLLTKDPENIHSPSEETRITVFE